jgi:hypothetical protein
LYNVKAAVQKYITDLTLSGNVFPTVGAAATAVVADATGKYGYPGPSTKCGVLIPAPTSGIDGNSLVKASTPKGTTKGIAGWTLDMAGSAQPQ